MSKDRKKGHAQHDAVELAFLQKVSERLPEDVEILQALADLYTRTGKYQEGLVIDLKLSHQLPHDNLVWYNLGCSYSLTNRPDDAFEALSKAVDLGYNDYDWMKTDPDLNNLHADPRFESLLSWLYSACEEED
ncbi:tetratricopeptide repeat protein [Pontiella sp.]|uniref:tetratricopeptide repeat protein n=1 Tax=Pontiella sp. TaxID=2837462 RepID=UPI003564B01A